MTVRSSLAIAALMVVYLLLLPAVSIGDVAVAGAVALASLAISRTDGARSGAEAAAGSLRLRSLPLLPGLIFHVLRDVVSGTWRVARVALRGARLPVPGTLEVRPESLSPVGRTILGLLVTLSPGTVLVDVSDDEEGLVFHVLGTDEDRFREYVRTLERRLDPMIDR